MQETLRAALAKQSAEHERRLEAALAGRDAEALEALRMLDAQHRGAESQNGSVPVFDGAANVRSGSRTSSVTQESGGKKRDRRCPRPISDSAGGVARQTLDSTPVSAVSRRSRSASKTAASDAVRSAAAARDAALREAKEESDRVGDPMSSSPGGSELSSPSPPSTAKEFTSAAVAVVGSDYGRLDGSPTPTTSGRLIGAIGYGAPITPVEHAPFWTVGNGSASARNRAEAEAEGLTATEQRYRRELETLRTRVRELEGMMEGRLEDRERLYRRKLRAAVSECRVLRVRGRPRCRQEVAGSCFVCSWPLRPLSMLPLADGLS